MSKVEFPILQVVENAHWHICAMLASWFVLHTELHGINSNSGLSHSVAHLHHVGGKVWCFAPGPLHHSPGCYECIPKLA